MSSNKFLVQRFDKDINTSPAGKANFPGGFVCDAKM